MPSFVWLLVVCGGLEGSAVAQAQYGCIYSDLSIQLSIQEVGCLMWAGLTRRGQRCEGCGHGVFPVLKSLLTCCAAGLG